MSELIRIDVDKFMSEDVKEKIQKINEATSVVQQLKDFKELTKIDDERLLRSFLKIYFNAKVRHPIKNCIFNVFKEIEFGKSFRIINEVIPKMISNLQLEERHNMINCIIEASQSFKIVLKVIGRNPEKVMEFLIVMLKLIFDEHKNERSPSEKNKISLQLHAVIQAIISCVKSHLQEYGKHSLRIEDYFKIIADICLDLLSEGDLSMDIKNNCGILIVMRNNIIKDESHLTLIRNNDEDCFKRLCLISGVILMLEIEDNIGTLFKICKILDEIYSTNSVDSLVVIAVLRLFVQLTKKIFEDTTDNFFCMCYDIAVIMINISLINIEHPVDSIKHLSKNTLKNLMEDGNSFRFLLNKLEKASISVQTAVIQSIIPVTSAQRIFCEMPDLQSTLLSSIHQYKENILTCYELISCNYYDESNFDEWFEKIIQPIIEELKQNQEAQGALRELLSQCIKKDAKAVEIVLNSRNEFDAAFSLTCLNAAKKAGLLDSSKSTATSWRGVATYDEIKSFIVNFDEKVQFSILQLLVDTKKSTEEFNDEEIDCIYYFYESNINIQNPSIRQSIIGMTKKFFERLNNLIKVHRRKNDEEKINKIFEICAKFQDFAINNFQDGSNHSRRMLSLKMLVNVLDVVKSNFSSESATLWNEDKFNAVFNMFYDNYEANKATTLEAINFIPRDEVKKFSKLTPEHLERLMTSIKTSDGLVAAYLIPYAINFSLFDFSFAEKSEIFSTSFNMLIWCENILLKALNIAQKSIIISSGSYTIYGPMLCLRYLTSKINVNDVKGCLAWKAFFSRIIKTCRHLTEVVAKIVNSSSPEGAYPKEEIEDCDEDTLRIIKNTTPQIILINAWRTVKEVSLFLGDISLRCSGIILSSEETLDIAEHLSQLMRKTIHRGAFEQAFYGFSQLCIALRLSHDPELHNLPFKILELLISSLSGEDEFRENIFGLEIKDVSATRRSAGLPFTFQALIVSEMKIASSNNFHFVMRNLITYARQGKQLGTRVHSLNILRGLFRCTELSEGIMEYISDAIQCSLLAYDAEEWPESNSSTLLFSALMIRIFGTQKSKNNEEMSIRNKMNAKVFFQRFPELYSFIFKLLHQAEQKVKGQVINTKLHPLLLLLNRLYNSNSDEDSSIKLTEFIPIIASCSGCVELQTRILCAKFIAANTPPSSCVTSTILSNIKSCREDVNMTNNTKHGKLLIILHLCKRDCVTKRESSEIIKEFFELIKISKNFDTLLPTAMDVMIECYSKFWTAGKIDADLTQILVIILSLESQLRRFSKQLMSQKMLALSLLQFHYHDNFEWILNLNNCDFYNQRVKSNCLLLILDYAYAEEAIDEKEHDPKICEFIQKLSKEKLTELRREIKNCQELNKFINNRIIPFRADQCLRLKYLEILSYLNYSKGDSSLEKIKDLTENAIGKHEALGNAMLKYARTCLLNEDKDFLLSINWEFLIKAVDSTYLVKSSTLDLMEILTINITFVTYAKTLYFYTKAMLNFLMDDDIDVRLKSSKIVSHISKHKDIFIASHAQSIFLKHLEVLCDKNVFLAIIILLAQQDTQNSNLDESEEEFQVFEHNDSNTFKERFLIKQLCTSILSEKGRLKINDEILNVCREIKGESFEEAEMTKFCENFLL